MSDLENLQYIAYLDTPFCETAKDYFCREYKITAFEKPFKTIKQVIEFISENPDSTAVLPVENSTDGTVRETLDNLITAKNPNIKILSEYSMPVHYGLLSRTTEIYSITGIIAPPDVLSKCSEYIQHEMPFNLNIIEAASIDEAARSLQNYNLTYASIGCEKTAEKFNLNILKDNINDDKSNYTKYILVGDYETPRSSCDTTCLAFTAENKPGALLNVLNVFMENQVNMSYIASYSSRHRFDEYIIIVNIDGHIKNGKILKTVKDVKDKTSFMKFLGSYPKSDSMVNVR